MDKILGSSDSAPPGPFFSRRELDRATNSSYNNMTRSHAMSLISRLIMLCCVSLLQTLKVINHSEIFFHVKIHAKIHVKIHVKIF